MREESHMRPSMTTNWPPDAIEATMVCLVFVNPVLPHRTEYGTVSAKLEGEGFDEGSCMSTTDGEVPSTVSNVFTW
jgi:hypothetical protein